MLGFGLGLTLNNRKLLPAPTNLNLSIIGSSIRATWTDAASAPNGYRVKLNAVQVSTVSQGVGTVDIPFNYAAGYRRPSSVYWPTPALPTPLRTFYVDAVLGDDSRSVAQAQNPLTPWKTTNKINANVTAGDLYLCIGTFTAAQGSTQRLGASVDGTALHYIAIDSLDYNTPAVFDCGTATQPTNWMFHQNYWRFGKIVIKQGLWTDSQHGTLFVESYNNIWDRTIWRDCGVRVDTSDNWFYGPKVEGSIGDGDTNTGDWFFIIPAANNVRVIRLDSTNATAYHSILSVSFFNAANPETTGVVIAGGNYENRAGAGGIIGNGKMTNGLIEDVEVHDISTEATHPNRAAWGTRGGIEVEGTDCIVREFRIWNVYTFGISLQGRADFNSFAAPCLRNHVYNGTIAFCGSMPIQKVIKNDCNPQDNVVENIICWEFGGDFEGVGYIVWEDQFNADIGGAGIWNGDSHGNIYRNIFGSRSSGTVKMLLLVRKPASGSNISYTAAELAAAYTGMNNNIESGDPLLAEPDTGDMEITSSSPCAGAGNPVVGVDIGAWRVDSL